MKKRNKKFYEKNQIVRFSERNKDKNKKPSISQHKTKDTFKRCKEGRHQQRA